MERKFHTRFYKVKPEVRQLELSRLAQKPKEDVETFLNIFKKLRSHCRLFLLEVEFVKIAQNGLEMELRKKFQGMEFRDFYELASKVTEYEELLQEDNKRKKKSLRTYYQETKHDVAVTEVEIPKPRVHLCTHFCICV